MYIYLYHKTKIKVMKANKTIKKEYKGITYSFTKTINGYKVSDGFNSWVQSTPSVMEAKRRRDN